MQNEPTALARLLASVYGLCLIALVVRVQVNLVSRYVHLDKLLDDETRVSKKKITQFLIRKNTNSFRNKWKIGNFFCFALMIRIE